jgi:hypothetical protein
MMELCVRRGRARASRQAGQVAVEAAIVMPLFVFLILGILQLGLTAQARVVAKYAAYRAARVGAMHNADPQAIQAAAIFHMLPVLVGKQNVILPTNTEDDVIASFRKHQQQGENKLGVGQLEQVRTVICGPLAMDFGQGGNGLGKIDQKTLNGRGSGSEVDFDDPLGQSTPDNFLASGSGGDSLRRFNRLRLRVQVQFLYRMPIPFANWVITKSYLGTNIPWVLRMPKQNPNRFSSLKQYEAVKQADDAKVYVVPINVSYAMRMQSNLFLSRFPLPEKNECIHYGYGN